MFCYALVISSGADVAGRWYYIIRRLSARVLRVSFLSSPFVPGGLCPQLSHWTLLTICDCHLGRHRSTISIGRRLLEKQLMTAVSGLSRLQNMAEPLSQEATSQLSHHLFLQLAAMESNFNFNKEFNLRLRRKTYSLK